METSMELVFALLFLAVVGAGVYFLVKPKTVTQSAPAPTQPSNPGAKQGPFDGGQAK